MRDSICASRKPHLQKEEVSDLFDVLWGSVDECRALVVKCGVVYKAAIF